jgi:hypothetical protein
MQRLSRWFIFLFSNALLLAQPTLRLKVHIDENPILRGARLPRLVPSHVIVQFDQPPTADTLDALKAKGAVVLQYVPDNAVLVLINDTVELAGLGIRSTRRLDSREKISPLITDRNATAGGGDYVVEFHPDVDPNAARGLILNAGLDLRENPDLLRQHLMVHVPGGRDARAALALLASQDQVAYIFPASANLVAGAPVNVCGGALTASGSIGQLIATFGNGWDGPGLNAITLSYVFQHVTAQLPDGVPQGEILRAMAEWAKVIQLTWQPGTNSLADRTVNILWATGDHGDGFPFDGPGGVIAHTFYPFPVNTESLAGDMHLDEAESWHVGTEVDVFSVSLHELGHALGLGHSDDPNDVMYPYLKLVTTLADGDKAAILGLYAPQTGTVTPPVPGPFTLTVKIAPDTTSSSSITLVGTATDASGPVAVTWISSGGASGMASLSGANWVASNIPLIMGLNNITVTATDADGPIVRTVSVTRTVPPSVSLALTINIPPAATLGAAIALSGTVTGGSGTVRVTWLSNTGAADKASVSGANWAIVSIPLKVGLNLITVTAVDSTGSVSSSVSVIRIASPLAMTIDAPPATTTSATIFLSGTVTGGTGAPSVSWTTGTGQAGGSSINGSVWAVMSIPLATGLNSITVTGADPSGNVSRVVNVIRTANPITLTINAPPATTTATTMSLSGTVTGGSGSPAISWTNGMGAFDGASISGTNWTISNIPLSIGVNTITVTAADATASVSSSVSVTRIAGVADTTGPTLAITYPSSTSVATTLASLTFTGMASDLSGVASVTFSTNTGGAGTASGSTRWNAVIPLLVGSNQVIIRAYDTAGNMSWRSVVVTRR